MEKKCVDKTQMNELRNVFKMGSRKQDNLMWLETVSTSSFSDCTLIKSDQNTRWQKLCDLRLN